MARASGKRSRATGAIARSINRCQAAGIAVSGEIVFRKPRPEEEQAVAGIMKYMRISDRARAEEGYEYYVDMMPVMPYASNGGVKAVLQFLASRQPKAATATPEDFYDHSLLKKIEASGFAKQFAENNSRH